MTRITEEHIDLAIKSAEEGKINGLTYDQSRWYGTSCCVLGFARFIAGLKESNFGPMENEFYETPKIQTIKRLMTCTSPDILKVMKAVNENGKINLRGADLHEADLYGADLRGANLRGANLRMANLYGADLREANLREADLREANLRVADLRWADLRWADLHEANLHEANLYGANFHEADLYGANLRGVKK